jgi:hypothetical protein
MATHQRSLPFDEPTTPAKIGWAEIVAAAPDKPFHRGLLLETALRQLHREGKPHDANECPECRKQKAELAG